ncbi:GGDEF domain-containing protein, partial [Photobacterium sanctipauli]
RSGLKDNKNLDNWRPELTGLTKELLVLAERNKALEKREKALLEQLSYNENKIQTLFEQTQDYRQRLNDQERRMFLDNLTKVYNRAALNDRLEHEYRRWLRYQHSVCVAMIDIDGFGEINSRFGHLAGDKVLKIIAKTIRQQLADTDFIARFADDAFMVILPDVSENERVTRLNKVRETIAQLPFRFRDQNVSISISIGATLFEGNDTPSNIIERTSKALSGARRTGNNRLLWIS